MVMGTPFGLKNEFKAPIDPKSGLERLSKPFNAEHSQFVRFPTLFQPRGCEAVAQKIPFSSGMTSSIHLYRCSKNSSYSSEQVFFVVIRLSLNAIFDTFLHPKTIPDHPNKKSPHPKKFSDGGL